MEITFLGMNCVRMTSKDLTVLCDPYPASTGLPEIKLAQDVTLLSVASSAVPAKAGMVIDSPGEYEVKGTTINGVAVRLQGEAPEDPPKATAYSVLIDGVRVGYLGNIASELTGEQVEALGQIDILVVPVGGHEQTLDATAAAAIISQLEPKFVVPTHFDDGTTKYDTPQDKLDVFLKEVGASPESQPKLRVTPKDLPLETTVVVLQRQGS